MTDRAKLNAEKVAQFKAEVVKEATWLQQRAVALRSKIEQSIGGYENLEGFLTGSPDDYIGNFDSIVAKLSD